MSQPEEIQRINRRLFFNSALLNAGYMMGLSIYHMFKTHHSLALCFFLNLSILLAANCINLIIHIRKLNKLSK